MKYNEASIGGEWWTWDGYTFASSFPPGTRKVVEYHAEPNYDGSGAAIGVHDGDQAFHANGFQYYQGPRVYYAAEYAHCSCNGPEETTTKLGPFTTYQDARRAIGYERENLPETEPELP